MQTDEAWRARVAEIIAAHQGEPGVMVSPTHPLYHKGYYTSCSCGWTSEGTGRYPTARKEDPLYAELATTHGLHVADALAAEGHVGTIPTLRYRAAK